MRLTDILARHESPGITARRARAGEARGLGADPIVWDRAAGANVWDVDQNRYVDLTGAFGVSMIGHAHPAVVDAVTEQSQRLMHAMGDVYPNGPRIALMEALAQLAPGDLSQCILGLSGSDAVEAALKTAVMASGRTGVVAFEDSYHGLSYGALGVSSYKEDFRRPFVAQLGDHTTHLPYGGDLRDVERLVAADAGAILVEPILGRGGTVVPPPGWLAGLRELATDHGAILIFDEIYTGLGRTGRWWAGDFEGVVPDVLVVGKALGGGMPMSAAIASPRVMGAWETPRGEAIHTSTFLGHPVGSAAALATLEVLQAIDAPARARGIEERVRARLGDRVRGRGAMLGVEMDGTGAAAVATGQLLKDGYIVLPCGIEGDVLALTPPLVITDEQLEGALDAIEEVISSPSAPGGPGA